MSFYIFAGRLTNPPFEDVRPFMALSLNSDIFVNKGKTAWKNDIAETCLFIFLVVELTCSLVSHSIHSP